MNKIPYIADFAKWEEEFSFFHEVSVRFCETDLYGHMNNTVAFVYFESARIEYFKSLGITHWKEESQDLILVTADLQCNYLAQIYFDEKIRIYVKTAKIGNSSADLHYLGKKEDGTVCLTGRGTIVLFSRKTGRPVPWPDEMKKKMVPEAETRSA